MKFRGAFFATLIACLGWGMLLPSAQADERVALLGLRAPNGDDALARNLTGSLRKDAAQISSWTLEPTKVSLDQLMLINGCDEPDEACLTRIAEELGVDQLVSGAVSRGKAQSGAGHDYRLELFVFDVEAGRIERRAEARFPRSKTRPEDLAAITGVEVAELASEPSLDSDAGSNDEKERRLVAQPSNRAEEPVDSAQTVHWWPAAATYSASAVFLGLTAWSWASINDVQNDPDFQAARVAAGPGVGDVCAPEYRSSDPDIDSLCSTAERHETLQWVFLSASLVSAAVGTGLLIRYRKAKKKAEERAGRWELSPLAGRREGGLRARLEF